MEYYIKKNGTDFLRAKKGNNVIYAKIEGLRTPFLKQEGYIVERVDRTVTGLIKRGFIHKHKFESEYMPFNPALYNPAHILATIDSFIEEVRPTLSATGKDIVINDITSDGYIKNLRITQHYSTQAGTPTPDHPVPILSSGDEGACNVWVHGKNLCDISNYTLNANVLLDEITPSSITVHNSTTNAQEYTFFFNNIRLETGKTYSIKRIKEILGGTSVGSTGQVELYLGNTWVKVILSPGSENATFTVATTGTYRARISITNNYLTDNITLKLSSFQIEEGTTATPYEPYNGSNVSIDYPDGYVGGSLPNGVFDTDEEMKLGKVVFNGSESGWSASSYTNDTIYSAYIYIPGYKNNTAFVSNKLTYLSNISAATTTEYVSRGGDSVRLGVLKSRLATQDMAGFKTWLASHPVTIYYELETPTPITLTKPQIQLPEGQVTITTTNNVKADLTVEYRK